MKTIKDYIQGERFVYGKKNCMVLEHMNDGTLCMVLDEDFESKFGETNNFAESELRKKLNGEYLDEWVTNGADRASFVLMQVNLTANDGLKDYGVYDPNAIDWGMGGWICNLCGNRNNNLPIMQQDCNPYLYAGSQYCPACGAKMVKEQES